MSDLIQINEGCWVNKKEVASVEWYEQWDSDSISGKSYMESNGVIVVLKNGRKIYLKGETVSGIAEKLK